MANGPNAFLRQTSKVYHQASPKAVLLKRIPMDKERDKNETNYPYKQNLVVEFAPLT